MIKEWFISQLEEYVHNYYTLSINRDLKWGELKKLTEFEFLLDDFIEMCELDPVDKINLERISTYIADKVRFDKIIFYYSSFYYLHNKLVYSNKFEDISLDVYRINIQINIMRIQIRHGMVSGCSEDNYYFSRGRDMINAIGIMIKKGEREGVDYSSILYVLLNYEQTLLEYIKSGDEHYYDDVCDLVKQCMQNVKSLCERFHQIQDKLKTNIKLKMFIYSVYNEYQRLLKENKKLVWRDKIVAIKNSNVILNNVWAIRNIYDLDKEYFVKYFEENLLEYENFYDKLYEDSKIMYLRDCIRWVKEKNLNKIRMLKLPPMKDDVDKSWFNIDNYINGYNISASVAVTNAEIEKVKGYNDEILRNKIASILKNIDRHVIDRESKKAHGVFEIADMELPIRKPFGETYYICIPVKSGVEISNKVTESITYQVIRPFTYFGNKAIVVFISAKDVTESFYNYVKRAKANLNFDIYILAGVELVKVLKYNNQIE